MWSSWGFLGVQEHRGETSICELVLESAMLLQNQRTPRESCDLRALLETHWGLPPVNEHPEEILIYDVEVVICNAMTKAKNTNLI